MLTPMPELSWLGRALGRLEHLHTRQAFNVALVPHVPSVSRQDRSGVHR